MAGHERSFGADFFLDLPQRLDQEFGALENDRTRGGDFDATRMPPQQFDTQFAFKFPDLPAERWLRDAQFFGGAR
ncbi:MAG TPA: hypothetical protein VI251_00595 [Pseudolabrys sp.]